MTNTRKIPSTIHIRLRLRSMSRKNWSAITMTNKSKKNQPIVPIPTVLSMTCQSSPAKASAEAMFNGVTRFITAVYVAFDRAYGRPVPVAGFSMRAD